MDPKRSNFLLPLGSGSKFLKPRSSRKQDLNATLIGTRSMSASTSNLNQTVRRNLDITMFGSENARSKAKLNAAVNDLELEYDLAYSEYLQALMKQEIVKNTIKGQETILRDQIIIFSETLQKLKSTYDEIVTSIENLKNQSEAIEQMNALQLSMDELNLVCNISDIEKHLKEMHEALQEKFSCVSTQNIKPLTSQEDYNRLIQALNDLNILGEKFLNSKRDFNKIKELAFEVRKCCQLKSEVDKLTKEIMDLHKKGTSIVMRKGSDLFAEQGDYF